MASRRHHNGDPGRRRIAFGTLTGLVSGFVVTLAVSLVVLGTTGAQSGLRLSIPGRQHTKPDSPGAVQSTTIPTFGQQVPAAVPVVTVVPVASVSSAASASSNPATAAQPRTPSSVPATAGGTQTAVPVTSSPSTTSPAAVPVDPGATSVPPTTITPTVTTTEPDPPAPTPAPTPTASAAAVDR